MSFVLTWKIWESRQSGNWQSQRPLVLELHIEWRLKCSFWIDCCLFLSILFHLFWNSMGLLVLNSNVKSKQSFQHLIADNYLLLTNRDSLLDMFFQTVFDWKEITCAKDVNMEPDRTNWSLMEEEAKNRKWVCRRDLKAWRQRNSRQRSDTFKK
jgi:hypothetical protein